MSERLVSPGIFTKENDLSFLPQGIAEIGAAFVGPTLQGPAFRPVIVESQQEYLDVFGATTPDYYTPYAVRGYLAQASRATIVRVLGLSGYDHTTVKGLALFLTGSAGGTAGEWLVGYLHPSKVGVSLVSGSLNGTALPTQFTLMLSGTAGGYTTYTSMSIDPTSANYFAKVLGTSATTGKDGFAYATFPDAASFVSGALAGSGSMVLRQSTNYLMLSGSTYGTYTAAKTPMIRSQLLGNQRYNLFQFFTLNDGTSANQSIKVSIANVRANPLGSGYGTFSVYVREFSDTDSNISILESFDNLTMDPSDVNYVARRIGTARTVIDTNGDSYLDGDWPNNSKYIYVSMGTGSDEVSPDALPYGFAALATPINYTAIPAPHYVTTRYAIPAGATTAVANDRLFYGFDFSNETGLSYLQALPSGSVDSNDTTMIVGFQPTGSNEIPGGGADSGFDLKTMLAAADTIDTAVSTATYIRKFTVPFQNGFDGQNPAQVRNTGAAITNSNTMGFNLSDSTTVDSVAYARAINTLANADAWDINMLLIPGVLYSQHRYIAQLGITLCENRGDCFFVMDPDICGASVTQVVNYMQDSDTSYAGVYHPWIKVNDPDSNKNIWVPPSVVMGGVYAFNDKVAAEWFAPAGLNRGGISEALQVRSRLDQPSRDTLYEGRINPIAQFPGQGIVTWGQKTLQQRASALDRINVRRLLIAVKKYIASTSRYLVFEQNVESTRQRFLSIVNPYLSSVQERNGLYAFKVVMDETNNTADIIDRNILVGDLYLKPTKTAEYIVLTFNVLPTGATFPA